MDISFEDLELDPDNPRLPEGISTDEDAILDYVVKHGTLGELAFSFLNNGFFEAERLIVIKSPRRAGSYTVVEGNRRLATLKVLHGELGEIPFVDIAPTVEQLARLTQIPCLLVDERVEVDRYLAYRHIGGMKTWSAEARARFTQRMVNDAVERGDPDPFRTIGKQVGSNAQGVRNSFIAIAVLEYARDELRLPTQYLQYDRFGVWIRCMNSGDIRSYIGVGSPKDYEDVQRCLAAIDVEKLAEVVSDLSVRPGDRRPLIADSRDITAYGRILNDEAAHTALRKHEDFEVARQVIDRRGFPARVDSIATSVSSIIDEFSVSADAAGAAELSAPVERLSGMVRSLRAIVRDLLDDQDD
jgi:hypothetical protein